MVCETNLLRRHLSGGRVSLPPRHQQTEPSCCFAATSPSIWQSSPLSLHISTHLKHHAIILRTFTHLAHNTHMALHTTMPLNTHAYGIPHKWSFIRPPTWNTHATVTPYTDMALHDTIPPCHRISCHHSAATVPPWNRTHVTQTHQHLTTPIHRANDDAISPYGLLLKIAMTTLMIFYKDHGFFDTYFTIFINSQVKNKP